MLFAIGFELLQAVIPFYAHDVLPEGSWLSSTLLLAVAIGSAVGCVPLFVRLARRTSKRQSYRLSMLVAACAFPLLGLAGLLPGIPVEAQVILATLLIGAPIGAHYLFPIPLTGDVIDDDSGRTHARREATYLGASHFVEHTASALAPLLLVLLMFAGNTRGDALGIRLVGPVGGARHPRGVRALPPLRPAGRDVSGRSRRTTGDRAEAGRAGRRGAHGILITILPSCSPASSRSWAARVSASEKTRSTSGRGPGRGDEVVGAEKVLARPHRGAVDDELLPPEAVQRRRRVRAARGAADDDAPGRPHRRERARPGRLADGLDDDVGARRRSPP